MFLSDLFRSLCLVLMSILVIALLPCPIPQTPPDLSTKESCTFHANMKLLDEGVEKLARFIESTRRVRGLSLAHNSIGPLGAQVSLTGKETLLFMYGGGAEDAGVKGSCWWFTAYARHVGGLSLAYNPIDAMGAHRQSASSMCLRESLQCFTALHCSVSHARASAANISLLQRLCKAMLVHRTVQSLDLPDNSLGDVGTAAIADLLDAGVKITSLQLSDNDIGDKGMVRLAQVRGRGRAGGGLWARVTSRRMQLSDNNIGNKGMVRLAQVGVRILVGVGGGGGWRCGW